MRNDSLQPAAEWSRGVRAGLPFGAWEALPLSVRLQHRLAEMLTFLGELQVELNDDSATSIRWALPEVQEVSTQIDRLLDRLAN